jgi:hypothetical protein
VRWGLLTSDRTDADAAWPTRDAAVVAVLADCGLRVSQLWWNTGSGWAGWFVIGSSSALAPTRHPCLSNLAGLFEECLTGHPTAWLR